MAKFAETPMVANRSSWIDGWKGLLILLVVVGHAVGGAAHMTIGCARDVCEFVYKVIYFFHMPAFFWVVGLCWRPRMESFCTFAQRRARRLLFPYLVFGVVSALLFVVGGGAESLQKETADSYYTTMGYGNWIQPLIALLHGGGWPHGEGFRCNSVLWFLPAMFTVSCAYFVLDKYVKTRLPQLVIASASLLSMFLIDHFHLHGLPLGLSVLPLYLPFVIFGRWIRFENLPTVCGRWPALTCGWCWFFLLVWLVPNRYCGVHHYGWYLAFLMLTFVGIGLSLQTARSLSRGGLLLFSAMGLGSMGIMLMHKFIVLGLQLKVPLVTTAIKSGGWECTVAMFAIVLAATAGSFFLSKLPFVRKIV